MPERITQINTYRDGKVTVGDYDDPAVQATVEQQDGEYARDVVNFQATVDMGNLNNKYEGTVSTVEKYFADIDLSIAPIRVITRETLLRAYKVAHVSVSDVIGSEGGRNINHRALVIEDKEMLDFFGEDFILGIMLHEAAHSSGNREDLMVRTVDEINEHYTEMGRTTIFELGGWGRIDRRADAPQATTGEFFEEAFADLTRVRAQRSMYKTHDLEGASRTRQLVGDTLLRVVPNGQGGRDGGTINLPAEFSMATKSVDGANWHATSSCNFASYALELLDNHIPGLYEDFVVARRDPRMQARAIYKIESVRKGLYNDLRDLPYSDEGFGAGLKLVIDTLDNAAKKAA